MSYKTKFSSHFFILWGQFFDNVFLVDEFEKEADASSKDISVKAEEDVSVNGSQGGLAGLEFCVNGGTCLETSLSPGENG